MQINIAGREISRNIYPYIIAEISGNHNGDIGRAKRLILAAKGAGADAVKLQTYRADTITIRSDRPEFLIDSGLWKGRTLYDLYEEAHTPWEWHAELFAYAAEIGITIFSSPFDDTAVELLESLGAPAYKIASAEIVDWGLLKRVAATGKPVIVSSGMATDRELEEALAVLRDNGAKDIVLLHCISAYPTPVADARLRRIPYLAGKFGVLSGLSDHSMGDVAAIAAVALGGCVIEKHFTLSRADGGVDSAFSLEKEELADFCTTLRDAHAAISGDTAERPASEAETRKFRRSLYFVKPLQTGEVIGQEHLKSIRPGLGLPPRHLKALIGRRAAAPVAAGTPTDWSLVEGGENQTAAPATTPAIAREALRRLALIPARGGSKRIPRKNVIDFAGQPMLSYPIRAAQQSGLFDLIHVSTDDDEIAAVAGQCGADANMRRPPELSDDVTPLLPVARWVLESFVAQGQRFDDVFILFPCSPLLEPEELEAAYDVYLSHGRQRNLLTVCRAPVPYEFYFRRSPDGRLSPIVPGGSFIRSQDLDHAYYETGTFTIFSREWLTGAPSLADDTNYVALELPVWKSVDIDTPRDLEYARLQFEFHRARRR